MWEWTDAWILQSVGTVRRPSALRYLIGSADYNVAIPTRDEIEGSVNVLLAAGLVVVDGLDVGSTAPGRSLLGRASKGRRTREVAGPLLALLHQEVAHPVVRPAGGGRAGEPPWRLSLEEWQAAYDAYYPPERRARG